jgi:hypothetical protein
VANSRINLAPSNSSTNYFAAGVTGAGPWGPFVTAGKAPDLYAHNVAIKNNTVTDHSAKTLTITGLDADGRPQSETRAAPGISATVLSAKFYSALQSISISSTIGADTFDISYGNLFVTPTFVIGGRLPIPLASPPPYSNIGTYFFAVVGGTINWTVQHSAADVNVLTDQEAAPWVSPNASLSAQTATSTASQNVPGGYQQYRVKVNSYSNAATLAIY